MGHVQVTYHLALVSILFALFIPKLRYAISSDDLSSSMINWTTQLGPLIGLNVSTNNGYVYQFRGIPFAKPPVGELRFKKTEKVLAWSGTLNATEYGASCVQATADENSVSEDCLYLNVFVPGSSSNNRAVMVWIHGGSFISGQGSSYDGSSLALLGDVVIVTINYRLNIFGFYATGDNTVPGNYGLWDQIMALRWVKDNIRDYTGDPNRITIFGESAGGVSVGLQAIIPQNKGIFQRVIAESGSSLGPRDSGKEALKVFDVVEKDLHCSDENASIVVSCLRNKPASQLKNAFYAALQKVQKETFTFLSPLGPTIDGDLFLKDREAILSDRHSTAMDFFRSLDYIAGENSAEAGLFYFDLLRQQTNYPTVNFTVGIPSNILCHEIIPVVVQQLYKNCSGLAKTICDKYSPTTTTDLPTQTIFAENLYSDITIYSSTARTLDAHTGSSGATYQYLFSYQPPWGYVRPRPLWLKGPNHADEIPFVFGLKGIYPSSVTITREDFSLSTRMMTYWTNFAKTGNPNNDSTNQWPQYTLPSKSYLNISVSDISGQNLYGDRMEFWNTYVPNALQKCDDTNVGATMPVNLLLSFCICFLMIYKIFM